MPLFFVLILITPINFRLKIVLNVNQKMAYVSIFLWKLRIIFFKLFVRDNSIFVLTKKKKKEIEISLSIKQIYFVEQFLDNLKDKVQPKKIAVYSKIGTNNAHTTAMICGTITALIKMAFSFLKNKKPTCAMDNNITPCFNADIGIFCGYLCFSITLFDLLYSLIISLFSLKRGVYERSKQSKLS